LHQDVVSFSLGIYDQWRVPLILLKGFLRTYIRDMSEKVVFGLAVVAREKRRCNVKYMGMRN